MVLALVSSFFGKPVTISVDSNLAYFAGLSYGDGYAVYGETRVVTSSESFKEKVLEVVGIIANQYDATFRVYSRPGNISDKPQITIALNSTSIRRLLFDESMAPRYETMHAIALDEELAPHFQAGLTDAEGTVLPPEPIESPHGRVFAMVNSDRRLLGIARLSLVSKLRLEPSSVRIRLHSRKGRQHTIRGLIITTRRNSYVLEVLSGAKRKWLNRVGTILRHPEKAACAARLISTYTHTKSDRLITC